MAVGRCGITRAKREGDGATPAGRHRMTGLMARRDRLKLRRATAIGPRDLWSDDAADPAYNTQVRAPHPFNHERLRRADPLYDIVLPTDWNAAAVPGAGSAIFVHVWRSPHHPTAGCVAFRRDHLRWIVRRLGPRDRLVVR